MTRIFSLIFSYYYVFLSLSVAMCGLGIGAFLGFWRKFEKERLVTIASLLALSYPLSILIPLKVTLFLSHPLLLSLFSIAPFILTGLFISLAYRFFHNLSGIIYFSDLIGAGLGSVLIILLLSFFSPINVIFLFSFLILLINLILFRRIYLIPFPIAILLFLFLNKDHTLLDIPYGNIPEIRDTKRMVNLLSNKDAGVRIEKTYWNPSFRTDVIYEPIFPDRRQIFIDGGTPTIMLKFNGNLNSLSRLKRSINYFPFLIAEKKEALSIGPGGGLDVILGLLAGFNNIDAVEINSDILKILKEYAAFNGRILNLKGVRFNIGEGRAYLKRNRKHYDLIYLALAQTATSSKMGLPLVESYLHTVDAYVDYLDHLRPKGLIAFICQQDFFLQRTIFNALIALNRIGIDFEEGSKHIIIVSNPIPGSPYKYLLLLRKSPYTLTEITDIRGQAERIGLNPEYYPYLYPKLPVEFSSSEEITEMLKEIKKADRIDVSPTSDEKPFFYDVSPSPPPFLYWLCLCTLLSSLLFSLFVKGKKSMSFIPYFSLLGAGFMLVEVSLLQKFIFFLGYPITTFSVILFSLLVGCGIGGLTTQRKSDFRLLPVSLVIICIFLLFLFLSLGTIMLHLFDLDDFLKVIFTSGILLPLGIFLGIPFPFAMKMLGDLSDQDTGLMWGINGMMSVFGSCLAIIIARGFGFKYSLLLAFFVYLVILFLSLRLIRR